MRDLSKVRAERMAVLYVFECEVSCDTEIVPKTLDKVRCVVAASIYLPAKPGTYSAVPSFTFLIIRSKNQIVMKRRQSLVAGEEQVTLQACMENLTGV